MSFDGLSAVQPTQFLLCDLELSDDGSSSVISEPEKRQGINLNHVVFLTFLYQFDKIKFLMKIFYFEKNNSTVFILYRFDKTKNFWEESETSPVN